MLILPSTHTVHRQRGFSLVEVLIALVIMSVGMLGIAGLYVHSLQAGRTSQFSHQAVTLAGDVADRIRANPTAGADYAGAGGANNACGGVASNCDATAMADSDIFLWKDQAQNTLPGGQVDVTYDDTTTPPQFTISVSWEDPGSPGGETPSYDVTIPVNGA
ncbi:MAG: type IV pilus modification protein PilV [Pseudomonadota bacterium]